MLACTNNRPLLEGSAHADLWHGEFRIENRLGRGPMVFPAFQIFTIGVGIPNQHFKIRLLKWPVQAVGSTFQMKLLTPQLTQGKLGWVTGCVRAVWCWAYAKVLVEWMNEQMRQTSCGCWRARTKFCILASCKMLAMCHVQPCGS